jgi:hypothetical protein
MDLADQLTKLQLLRESGALTEAEFTLAKQKLIHADPRPIQRGLFDGLFRANERDENTLGKAANRYVSLQMVMAVIGIILFLIFFLTVFLPGFNRVNSGMPRF